MDVSLCVRVAWSELSFLASCSLKLKCQIMMCIFTIIMREQARSENVRSEKNTKNLHHHHDLTKSLENKQTSLSPTCSLILTMASLNNIDCDKITTLIFDVDDTLYDVGNGFTAHRNSDVSTLNPLSSTC